MEENNLLLRDDILEQIENNPLTCGICFEEILNTPQVELLCHHKFHTECFMRRMHPGYITASCNVCLQQYLPWPPEEHLQEQDNRSVNSEESHIREINRVSTLYDTNPKFKKDIQTYKKRFSATNKPRLTFQRFLRRKREELNEFANPLITRIREYCDTKIQEIKASQEYREILTKERSLNAYTSYLRRTYRMWSFRGLREKPGLRNLHFPRYLRSSSYLIRYAMRMRIGRGRRMRIR